MATITTESATPCQDYLTNDASDNEFTLSDLSSTDEIQWTGELSPEHLIAFRDYFLDHNLHNEWDKGDWENGPLEEVNWTPVLEKLKQEQPELYQKLEEILKTEVPQYKGEDHEMTLETLFEDLCENCLYQSWMKFPIIDHLRKITNPKYANNWFGSDCRVLLGELHESVFRSDVNMASFTCKITESETCDDRKLNKWLEVSKRLASRASIESGSHYNMASNMASANSIVEHFTDIMIK